ncbi:ESPR-type extended signal peptide-containing protein, partial [Psychrobacter sp. 1Y4]|uniref:ESPR-type extended signal peptide-containing protein n=1 Tax=Psychrobacter sp. 1Y4 TaxID=3453575 RepID=UPI003F47A23E
MNRNYKVIWNQSLNCFMAVAEYAKSRGKSSSTVVSSNAANVSNGTTTGGAHLLRLSALCIGLASAGFSMQASAIAACAEDNASGVGIVDRVQCGTGANAEGSTSVAIGQNAQATGGQSIAIGGVDGGQNTTASGDQSTAIGANAVSSGSSSIAIGGDDLNKASGTTVNPDGTETVGTVNSGEVNTTFKKYSGGRNLVDTTQGGNQYPYTESSGAASVAIGVQAVSSGALSTAFGTQANATGVASSAFGVSAEASKEGSVAIGAGSKTDGSATKIESQTVNGITFTGFDGASGFAGNAGDAGRQVSVGLIGSERQIKNVAPGEISASSTDAINGSQVFSVTNKLVDNIRGAQATADAVADGTAGIVRQDTGTGPITVGAATGGTSVNFTGTDGVRTLSGLANGNVAANSTEAVTGDQLNTTNTNIAAAQNVANTANTTANSALTKANLGFDITADNGTQDNVQLGEAVNFTNTDNNLVATVSDNGINYDLADNISVNQVTVGDATNNTVLTSTANGLDIGGDKITNVADGTIAAGSTDAVTGNQLNATNTDVTANTGNITTNTGNIADLASGRTGIVRQDAGTGAITVGAATGGTSVNFTGTDGVRTLSGLANGNVVAGSTEAVTGDQLNTTNSNVTTAQTTANTANTTANSALTKANLGFDITADNGAQDNVQLGEAVNFTNTDGNLVSTVSDNGINYDLADNISVHQVTVGDATNNTVLTSTANGLDIGGDKITNVADGTIAAGSTDAVTGNQLNATNTDVTANTGNITTNSNNITTNTAGIADNSNRSVGNLSALGGNAAYDAANNTYTAPSYVLDDGTNSSTTSTFRNVGDALGNLD